MLKNQQLLFIITIGWSLVGTNSINAQSTIRVTSVNKQPINHSWPAPSKTQQSSTNRIDHQPTINPITQVSFTPPPKEGKPDKTTGAGSRQDGQCPQDLTQFTTPDTSSSKLSLAALVPNSNYGLTGAERPTFLVYLPKTSAKQIVLSIKEEGIKHYSQTFLPITQSAGIIKIKPSDDTPPLQVNKNYQWAVVLVCGERPGPNDPMIASWVRRVDLPNSTSQQLAEKTPLMQAAWYGNQGIWYDSLVALAQARQVQSHQYSMTQIWANFLTSVGLESFSNEKLQF
ncbi:DUF928 domain-containing protein [Gloeothece verrucosa]|uniref:DUF928 domain-containing protein n=1 Tax=Gloeothece verrucosa (strain PCC 7822) TaxID=497965 RepID=E0UFK3_GLOV7|nr:DUF928 domain-containing protein [Gloeothece verrucosa]ADN16697.1 protein of unknown function DUF928 [Gloeothece verrucosa PCC 7822]